MNREELFKEMQQLVPSQYEADNGFIDHLKRKWLYYQDEIISNFNEFPITVKSDNDDIIEFDRYDVLSKVHEIINYLYTIVDEMYSGSHHSAYMHLGQLLNEVLIRCDIKTIPKGSKLYRMRTMQERNNVNINDLFHIPLNKRGIVKTQRYSAPGYPCLYLGESIYVCWEEMLRPNLSNCFVSKLENQEDIKLLDISMPVLSEWLQQENGEYTMDANNELLYSICRFPLVMACMVKVNKLNDIFKPEYIVPQLIMEFITHILYVRKQKEEKPKFIGVYYTTVQQHEDFEFISTDDNSSCDYHLLNNIAIPVLNPTSQTRFCPELCDMFLMTKPTCDEFERAKMPYFYSQKFGLSISNVNQYQLSTFGQLEERLDSFPLMKIEPQ